MALRNSLKSSLVLALCTLAYSSVQAADVEVKTPWVRGTVPGQQATGAFLEVSSKEGATLIGASSPVAGVVEVHEMKMVGGVMKMGTIPRLDLPAGKPVALKPGGHHVMLMELKQPLKKGDTVPLFLRIESKDKSVQSVEVKAEVRDLTAAAPSSASSHDHKH